MDQLASIKLTSIKPGPRMPIIQQVIQGHLERIGWKHSGGRTYYRYQTKENSTRRIWLEVQTNSILIMPWLTENTQDLIIEYQDPQLFEIIDQATKATHNNDAKPLQ